MRASQAAGLATALMLTGCLAPRPPAPHSVPEADPNPSLTLAEQTRTESAVQAVARTSLLEDNEHLRELLNKALTDKQKLVRAIAELDETSAELEKQAMDKDDAITALSDRIATLEARVRELEGQKATLTEARRTLAEMYAVEKRQRLAFEKELLEREIAERTLGGGEEP